MREPGRHFSLLLGAGREFCCAGCEAVAHTIVDGGFGAYYRTRMQAARRPEPLPELDFDDRRGEATLILERITCAACLWLIEQVLARQHGVSRVEVNYATRRARVAWQPGETGLRALVGAVRAVGYDATPYDAGREQEIRRRERRTALWRLFVAGFGAMQVMMYAFPTYVGAEELSQEAGDLMRWASLVLTAPVLAFACQPFFAGALREIAARRLGLETPIALGLAAGFAASAWASVSGRGEVYFDSISMLAFLLLAARYAQAAALERASSLLDRLLAAVPAEKLAVGERVSIAPGERVPADGLVEEGVSSVDESLLTGESRPVPKRPGEALVAGSVNFEQPLVMRVTCTGDDTQAAAIARLAERAHADKPRLVAAADRAARTLTGVVLAGALGGALYWGDVWIAVAVLVATCPCALGLAAPVVLTRANARLFARGALVTRSSCHQALERVTDVVFDKTGTLTAGELSLARTVTLGSLDAQTCIGLARSLEASSRHPLARAFGDGPAPEAASPLTFPGLGLEALVDGRRVRIGAEAFCRSLARAPHVVPAALIDSHSSWVYLAGEEGWLAAFEVHDSLRPEAAALLAELGGRGIELHLASGDRAATVGAVARALGIARSSAGMAPQDKCAYVERLQRAGRVVAMVGDGLNDAPVLARADVSFAMASGADAAQLRADVVLTASRLGAVAECLDTSRRAMGLVRSGLAWALAYNGAVLPLALLGWIGPWEAALGMAASSLIVVLNALRPLGVESSWKASTSSSRSRSLSYS